MSICRIIHKSKLKHPLHKWAVSVLTLIFPLLLSGQQYNLRNLSVAEGLAQSQVYAICENRNGYLWFGTHGGGLSRFDGKEFRNFSVRDGLADNYISALALAPNGNLLIGTSKGLTAYDGAKFTNYALKENREIRVSAIYTAPDGLVWLGTGEGIYHLRDSTFTPYSEQNDLPLKPVSSFFRDSRNVLWVGGDFGVLQFLSDNNIKQYRYRRKELNSNSVQAISEDAKGRIWVATYGGGINIFSNNEWSRLLKRDGLGSNRTTALFRDKKDQMWVGTQDAGISIYQARDSSFFYLNESEGLPNSYIRTIQSDSWGNIWLGTSGGGVSRYYGQQFTHYNKDNGLIGNFVYALAQDTTGSLWFSASRRGVTRFDGQEFKHFGTDKGFTEMKTKALLADSRGRIWIGTDGRGVAVYDSTGFYFYEGEDGLSGSWIRALREDSLGNVWIGTAGGGITKASMLPGDSTGLQFKFRQYWSDDGLSDRRINDLHIDRLGRVWYATRGSGIGFISQDSLILNFGRAEGLPYLNVRSLAEDSTGVLWLGTAGNGVLKLPLYQDSFRFEKLLPSPRLTSDNVYLLGFDKAQNLYVGSEVGIDKIELDAERNPNTIKHFGKSEGFVGIETCQNAVLCDAEGNMWFGTINGLTQYNPERERSNATPPKIRLTETRLFYEPLAQTEYADALQKDGSFKSGFALPYRDNNLGFEFIGINQSNPEKVRYRWQLEGLETEASPFSSNTNATYANLPPGDYTFKVWAENEDGIITAEPAQTGFSILKPFWQKWWFYAGILTALLLLIALIFRSRVNQIRRRAATEKERLETENTLLQLEQKALQLQMNPHFIFNALAGIQGLISKQDQKTARYYLAKFGKLMRAVLENSRSEKITLEDEIELLENYLALESFSRGNSFDYEIEVQENCEPGSTEIPPMLLQPFVENAIIHGVATADRRGVIKLSFAETPEGRLRCTIEDNGIGRTKAAELKNIQGKTHKSLALTVTRERLEMLHPGKRNFWLEDLNPGTRVVLIV